MNLANDQHLYQPIKGSLVHCNFVTKYFWPILVSSSITVMGLFADIMLTVSHWALITTTILIQCRWHYMTSICMHIVYIHVYHFLSIYKTNDTFHRYIIKYEPIYMKIFNKINRHRICTYIYILSRICTVENTNQYIYYNLST